MHFTELFGRNGTLDHDDALQDFLVGSTGFSAREDERYEKSATTADMIETLSKCSKGKSLRLDGLSYVFYKSMPELFKHQLASSLSHGVVTLIRKDLIKEDIISNFRLISAKNRVKYFGQGVSKMVGSCRGGTNLHHP